MSLDGYLLVFLESSLPISRGTFVHFLKYQFRCGWWWCERKKIFLWPGLPSKGQQNINSVENRRNRKICCRLTLLLFTWPRLLIFYVLFTLPVTNRLRGVVPGGAGGAMATLDFCRSVYYISTREGADYAHRIILAPPDFQTFLRPW